MAESSDETETPEYIDQWEDALLGDNFWEKVVPNNGVVGGHMSCLRYPPGTEHTRRTPQGLKKLEEDKEAILQQIEGLTNQGSIREEVSGYLDTKYPTVFKQDNEARKNEAKEEEALKKMEPPKENKHLKKETGKFMNRKDIDRRISNILNFNKDVDPTREPLVGTSIRNPLTKKDIQKFGSKVGLSYRAILQKLGTEYKPRFSYESILKMGGYGDKSNEIAKYRPSKGTAANPFKGFRGDWSKLPNPDSAKSLAFDVGGRDKDGKEYSFPVHAIKPLSEFRRLRVLKITGMKQSYQEDIWTAVWLNPMLEELELSMATEPTIRKNRADKWPVIQGDWRPNPTDLEKPVNYGDGYGNLRSKFGTGAYLDKHAIEKAKVYAMMQGPTMNKMGISSLTLTGFVVDADPFIMWFDHKYLSVIDFKDKCIDSGFYCCKEMKMCSIICKAKPIRRVTLREELKMILVKNAKKAEELDITPKDEPKDEGVQTESATADTVAGPSISARQRKKYEKKKAKKAAALNASDNDDDVEKAPIDDVAGLDKPDMISNEI